ncbi:MAG: hypothetical protein GX025_09855 [Clostridiales bacterium]|nr:hypothetical protein [Clostridiales bacterium]
MKNAKCNKTLYLLLNLLLVVIVIASGIILRNVNEYYRKMFEMPTGTFILYYAIPIVVSILLFVKLSMQRAIPVSFSKIVNILTTLVFVAGIAVFYIDFVRFGFFIFIAEHPEIVLVFCVQICSLVYDFLPRKTEC